MENKRPEIQDERNLVERVIGVLLLDECPKCNKYAYTPASYGYEGHCSACDYKTPLLIAEDEE
ncbi:MAG TPA: hypothetical protein VIS54_08265 [Psychromonas sp.]